MNRPIPATLGGFAIGFATGLLGGALPTNQSQYLPSFLFAAVILVLLVRPRGLFDARRPRWSACEAPRRLAGAASAPVVLVVVAALLGTARLALDADVLHRHAREGRDRRRALRVHRQLGRALVRAHQLRRDRRVDGRRALGAGGREAGDHAEPRALPARPTRSATCRRSLLAAVVGGVCALLVGTAADAALGPRSRHRDVRRARDHAQRAAVRGADRPGPEHVLVGAGDDRPAPGGDRRARRGRRRLRLRAEPLRAPAARDARGSPRPRVPSASRSTASGSSRSRSPACSPGSPAASTCTCCRCTTESVYLDLTFITLAMLVVGGATSLWGAVVGALAVSALDSFLAGRGERHVASSAGTSTCPREHA